MKVSTKGRYALRMLLELAQRKDEGFISLKEISRNQDISKQYLEQIVSLLNTSDILRANRGKQGGYMLAKEPSMYTVGHILRVTEGSLSPIACLDDKENQCERVENCSTLSVWKGLYKTITDYLDNMTLQDILDYNMISDGGSYVI